MGRIVYGINLYIFQWKKYLVFKTLNHSSTMLDDRDWIFPFIDFHLLSNFLPGKCLLQPSHLLFVREDFLWFPDKIMMPPKQFSCLFFMFPYLSLFFMFPVESWSIQEESVWYIKPISRKRNHYKKICWWDSMVVHPFKRTTRFEWWSYIRMELKSASGSWKFRHHCSLK